MSVRIHNMQNALASLTNRLLGPTLDAGLKKRLASGTGWTFIGSAASRVLVLLGSIAAARILSQETFGQFGIIQSTFIVLGGLASFGMSVTATKHVAEHRQTDPLRAGSFIRAGSSIGWYTGGLMALLTVVFGPWLARETLAAPELGPLLQLGAATLVLTALAASSYGSLTGLEAFRRVATANTGGALLAQTVLVAGALAFGLRGAVLSLIAGAGLTCLLLHRALVRTATEQGIPLKNTPRVPWSVLWSFSLPAVMTSLITGPVQWAAQALLAHQPGGYSELGSYNAANQWLAALMFLPAVLSQTMLPMLSERIGARDHTQAMRLMTASIRINALAVWPVALVGAACSPWIMALYGPGFVNHWPAMALSLINAAVLAMLIPVGQVLAASNRMWVAFWMNVAWGAALLLFTFLLMDRGSTGVALARLLAYSLHAVWTIAYAWHLLRQTDR